MKPSKAFALPCPTPASEETINGIFGRMARLNGTSKGEFLRNTYFPARIDANDGAPRIGLTASQLINEHSLLPFSQAHYAPQLRITPKNGRLPKQIARLSTLRGNKRSAFCGDCVEEDLQSGGFSQWRRVHQIQGVIACHKHGRKLTIVNSSQSDCLPSDFWPISETPVRFEDASFPVKFAQVAFEILQNRPKLERGVVAHNLLKASYESNVPYFVEHRQNKFRFEQHFGAATSPTEVALVLDDLSPVLHRGESGFEHSLLVRHIAMAFFVFAAVGLRETVAESFKLLTTKSCLKSREESAPILTRKLMSVYSRCSGKTVDIARKLDEPYTKIVRSLENHGLPAFKLDAGKPVFDALSMIIDGADISRACALSGAKNEEVMLYLRQSLVPLSKCIDKFPGRNS